MGDWELCGDVLFHFYAYTASLFLLSTFVIDTLIYISEIKQLLTAS